MTATKDQLIPHLASPASQGRNSLSATARAVFALLLLAPAVFPAASTSTVETIQSGDEIYFGTRVPDPFRWLEDSSSERTRAWTAEQNAKSRTYLDALPARAALRER